MNSLNLNQPLLIVLVGLPGAGKSFFARQFSAMFGAPAVEYNRLRYELFEHPTYAKDQEDLVARLASLQLQELLKTKRTIIIDGAGSAKIDRQRLVSQAKRAGYGHLIVWVQTDPATCKQRSAKRASDRPEDTTTAPLDTDQFNTTAKKFTPPTREDHIVISGKHIYATQAKMVLRKLAAPRQDQAQQVHRAETKASRQLLGAARTPRVHRHIIN